LSPPPRGNIQQAFDAARFGPSRTLNLRDGLPSGDEAAQRAIAWLRERQVTAPGEDVLIITGRGKGSPDGVPVVREAVQRLFPMLRRRGVIVEAREHNAPRRNKRRTPPPEPRDPAVLAGLDPETRAALRRLADYALDAFGVSRRTAAFVADEMVRQYSRLVESLPETADRDVRLRRAIDAALEEYE
jgi:hypothetical protein